MTSQVVSPKAIVTDFWCPEEMVSPKAMVSPQAIVTDCPKTSLNNYPYSNTTEIEATSVEAASAKRPG